MNRILVIAGPSAVGKTTVMSEILSQSRDFEYIRSATTRPPRGDGRDSEYIYLSREEFFSCIDAAQMLEYTEFGGNFYGTPLSEVERVLKAGKNPLLILDINGVISLKNSKYKDIVQAVWLWDEESVLEVRLRERISLSKSRDEGEKIFASRIAENKRDFERVRTLCEVFDVFIQNRTVADSVKEIKKSLNL